MQRQIIRIDESRCDGCGQCIVGCPEGALQLIDGKARIVSESTCDGLGACIKECPKGAISVETREALEYDELETLSRILPQGVATLKAHLKHLYDHAQTTYLEQALSHLRAHDVAIPEFRGELAPSCPGSTHRRLPTVSVERPEVRRPPAREPNANEGLASQLEQWPIQLHLIQPRNPVFSRQSVLLAADCVAFALPNFNQKYLPGKRLLVACPKLDHNQDIYLSKLVTLIDDAEIAEIHVLIMEVPCCGGLLQLAQTAARQAKRSIPIKTTVVGLDGEVRYAS